MKMVQMQFHKYELGVLLNAIALFMKEPIPEIDTYVASITEVKVKLALDELKKEERNNEAKKVNK